MRKTLPSQETLRKLLEYHPETGDLKWKIRTREFNRHQWFNKRFAGCFAMTNGGGDGYKRGTIGGVSYLAHRVIWKLVHGEEPEFIDHIDGDVSNNRIANLRSVTHKTNCRNLGVRKTNTSGVNGVSWKSSNGKWVAQGTVGGKRKHLGLFSDIDQAKKAVTDFQKGEDGYSERHGTQDGVFKGQDQKEELEYD